MPNNILNDTLKSAILLLDKCLPIIKQVSYLKGKAEVLKIYGNLYQIKNNIKLINQYYQKALKKGHLSADEMLTGSVFHHIGISHIYRSAYAEAL